MTVALYRYCLCPSAQMHSAGLLGRTFRRCAARQSCLSEAESVWRARQAGCVVRCRPDPKVHKHTRTHRRACMALLAIQAVVPQRVRNERMWWGCNAQKHV